MAFVWCISIILYLGFYLSLAHEIKVTNRCSQTIWVGTYGDNNQIPAGGNFKLDPSQQRSFPVIYGWISGRVWGKTGCDNLGNNCKTGNAPKGGRTTLQAVTLAEFGMDKYLGLDFYDISLVDGFNLPITIQPYGVNLDKKCKRLNCNFNFNVCPDKFREQGSNGIEACKSACSATREGKYCCPEPTYSRETCKPSDYSRIFKNQCPDAYSYAYDDETSVFACKGQEKSSSSYEVIFC